jgi:two-component system sensor histidine kinase HydH
MKINKEELIIYALAVPLFAALILLSVLIVAREETHNRELVQFEALRIAAELFPLIGRPDLAEQLENRPEVLGLGLYAADGTAEVRLGSAPPASLPPENVGAGGQFQYGRRSLVMLRRLGGFQPMMRAFPGRGPMPGGAGGMGRPRPGPAAPRTLYLELDLREEWRGRQDLLRAGLLVLPASFVVLFFLLLFLYRRLSRYRAVEDRQRVLVQLGEASRTLAHEIRNPLGAIRVRLGILKKVVPPAHARNLEVIAEEVERLNQLVDRVGEFLKNPRGNPEPVELAGFLRGLREKFPHPIELAPQPGECWVSVDPQRLRVVVDNLLRNAAESYKDAPAGGIELSLAAGRKTISLTVADRGGGLGPGDRERLFDPFFTTKDSGSGIGLAVSRRFVEAAGGRLGLEPRPDGGTLARLELPAMEKA